MEENLRPRLIPAPAADRERAALRGFGIGLGILFLLLAWRIRSREGPAQALAALGAVSAVVGGVRPSLLKPFYRVWMPLVGALARVNLWLIIRVLYYGVVTPYGLFLRVIGLKPLDLGPSERATYWEEKPPRDSAESARNIF